MKITRVEIKNFRSLFADDSDDSVAFDVAEGMNTLVGINNCGKSNILKAIAVALDPRQRLQRDRDLPAGLPKAVPWITLTLGFEKPSSMEKTFLRYAEEYERATGTARGTSFAEQGIARLAVSFPGSERSGRARVDQLQVEGRGAVRGEAEVLQKALVQLRKCYRLVTIESGQSLEDLLAGRFREILHNVLGDHLKAQMDAAVRRRSGYVESLQQELLEPLRTGVQSLVGDLFPDITEVSLVPKVSAIDETLSDVEIRLRDLVDGSLSTKGTGVRGGVMVAMLRYLAEHTRQSMVFAVEEPEAFLHPGAQEDLRDDLEGLAERSDVTLFVSIHSPFIVSRRPESQIIALTKKADGRTTISGCARGDESKASYLGDLFRDAALADVLERSATVPSETKAVVITEGLGDIDSIRLAASRAGRLDLLDGLHLSAAGSATKAAAHAVITKSQTAKPVLVLLDNDDVGKKARDLLADRFGFQKKKDLLSYCDIVGDPSEAIEAEDLWPSELMARFVAEKGEDAVMSGKWLRKDGGWHFDIRHTAKVEMGAFLDAEVTPADCSMWVELLELIRKRMGM